MADKVFELLDDGRLADERLHLVVCQFELPHHLRIEGFLPLLLGEEELDRGLEGHLLAPTELLVVPKGVHLGLAEAGQFEDRIVGHLLVADVEVVDSVSEVVDDK